LQLKPPKEEHGDMRCGAVSQGVAGGETVRAFVPVALLQVTPLVLGPKGQRLLDAAMLAYFCKPMCARS
jgi:hypothetical protein